MIRLSSVKPLSNLPIRIQSHALTPERPAHIAHAHEIRRRHAVRHADFHAQQRRLAAKTHRADAEFVRRFQNVLLQRIQLRLGIAVVQQPEKLRLAQFIARRAVAADAHAQHARPAAFALRLQYCVEDRLAAAVEIAIRVQRVVRQRVLRADVFATAALERQLHGNFRRTVLMKMKRRRARPDVRAIIFAGERIHGILAEITFLRRQRHGFARRLGERHLIVADRHVHKKQNAAGVLADGLRLGFRERDVLVNDLEGVGRERIFLLVLQRRKNRAMDVVGNLGRRAADEFDEGI